MKRKVSSLIAHYAGLAVLLYTEFCLLFRGGGIDSSRVFAPAVQDAIEPFVAFFGEGLMLFNYAIPYVAVLLVLLLLNGFLGRYTLAPKGFLLVMLIFPALLLLFGGSEVGGVAAMKHPTTMLWICGRCVQPVLLLIYAVMLIVNTVSLSQAER